MQITLIEADKDLGGNHSHFEGAIMASTYSRDNQPYTSRHLCALEKSFGASKNFGKFTISLLFADF